MFLHIKNRIYWGPEFSPWFLSTTESLGTRNSWASTKLSLNRNRTKVLCSSSFSYIKIARWFSSEILMNSVNQGMFLPHHPFVCHQDHCYSKCVHGTKQHWPHVAVYWKDRISGPTQGPLNRNSNFNTISKWFICTLKLENPLVTSVAPIQTASICPLVGGRKLKHHQGSILKPQMSSFFPRIFDSIYLRKGPWNLFQLTQREHQI